MDTSLVEILVLALTPFVVKFATDIVKSISSKVTGLTTLVVVTIISALGTFASGLAIEGSPHWYFQFLIGLLAVFVDQVKKQWDIAHQ